MHLVAQYSGPFIQRIPEIGKISAGVILASLVAETALRRANPAIKMQQNLDGLPVILGITKSVQMISCLRSAQFFRSKWVSMPVYMLIGWIGTYYASIIKNLNSDVKAALGSRYPYVTTPINFTLLLGNVVAKVVNSFAIGLLAQKSFGKDSKPGVIMVVATIATLTLSAWNIYQGWNDSLPNKK